MSRLRPGFLRANIVVLTLLIVGSVACAPAAALDGTADRGGDTPLLWRYVPGGLVRGPVVPAPDGGNYFVAEDWYLYRIDADGTAAFRFDLRARPLPLLTAGPGGSVIAATSDGRTVVVSSAGRQVALSGGTVIGSLLSDPEGLVYTVHAADRIVCTNVSGRALWSVRFDRQLSSISRAADGDLLCADSGGRLYGLDRWGRFLWTTTIDARVRAAEVLPDSSRILVLADTGILYCLDTAGRLIWRTATDAEGRAPDRSIDAPAAGPIQTPDGSPMSVGSDGLVYLLDADGSVSCYAADGRRSFRAVPPSGRFTAITAAPGGLYASTDNGVILLLDAHGVATAAAVTPEATSLGKPWVMPDGSVVVDGANWVLYAFSPMTAERAPSPEPSAAGLDPASWTGNPDYISLRSRLFDGTPRDLQNAVSELTGRVADGRLRGSLPYVTYLLGETLSGRSVPAQPAERSAAASALGNIAIAWARKALLSAAGSERDPAVLGSISRALGSSAPDLDGSAQRALLELLLGFGGREDSVPLVQAIADAFSQIRRSTGTLTAAGVEAITRLNALGIAP